MFPTKTLSVTEISTLKKSVRDNLNRLDGKKVLIVGDVCLDEYIMGDVQRISPEAPVPVLEVRSEDRRLGLAANVAQNVASLGGTPVLLGVIGADATGDRLKELLKSAAVTSFDLMIDDSRPTTRKTRVMSGHHHLVRVDYEHRRFLSNSLEDQLLERVKAQIKSAEVIVIQDYAKGVVSERLAQTVIEWGRADGKKVLVDPHRQTPLHYYRGATLIKPNWEEAFILSGLNLDDLREKKDSYLEVGQIILEKTQCEHLIITRGKEGMCLFSQGRVTWLPTAAVQVFDVTGAGDTVIAALSLAWAGGFDLISSCTLANYAGGIVVAKVGCVPCERQELLARLTAADV